MLLNCSVGEDSWESLELQGDSTSPSQKRSVLGVPWKDWCWSWNSNTSCDELTHWKRPRCWEGLGAGGEGDDRGWDGWMASLTRWTWVWVNSGSWWWTGRPGVLQFMGSQRAGHDWATELNRNQLCFNNNFKKNPAYKFAVCKSTPFFADNHSLDPRFLSKPYYPWGINHISVLSLSSSLSNHCD